MNCSTAGLPKTSMSTKMSRILDSSSPANWSKAADNDQTRFVVKMSKTILCVWMCSVNAFVLRCNSHSIRRSWLHFHENKATSLVTKKQKTQNLLQRRNRLQNQSRFMMANAACIVRPSSTKTPPRSSLDHAANLRKSEMNSSIVSAALPDGRSSLKG